MAARGSKRQKHSIGIKHCNNTMTNFFYNAIYNYKIPLLSFAYKWHIRSVIACFQTIYFQKWRFYYLKDDVQHNVPASLFSVKLNQMQTYLTYITVELTLDSPINNLLFVFFVLQVPLMSTRWSHLVRFPFFHRVIGLYKVFSPYKVMQFAFRRESALESCFQQRRHSLYSNQVTSHPSLPGTFVLPNPRVRLWRN